VHQGGDSSQDDRFRRPDRCYSVLFGGCRSVSLERERHGLLRQLYSLMDLFEAGQEADAEHPSRMEKFLSGLLPLLETDVHLASVTEKISNGTSELYAKYWDPSNLEYKLRHAR
jgi:hypothetical protein